MNVINISNVAKAAYLAGYGRFSGYEAEIDEPEGFDLSHFTESAEYANVVAPKLRQFSGYGDGGMGTYTHGQEVLVVTQDEAEELAAEAGWIEGDVTESHYVFETVHEAWSEGCYDAVFGEEKSERYTDLRIE